MIEDNDLFNFTQKDISRMRKEFEILLTRLTIYNSRLQQELLEEGCILIIDDAEEGDNGDGDVNSHGNVDVDIKRIGNNAGKVVDSRRTLVFGGVAECSHAGFGHQSLQ